MTAVGIVTHMEPMYLKGRARPVMLGLKIRGFRGCTWKELAELQKMHHGQASGVLSWLHKHEFVVRLKEKREKCSVYVLPEYVHDRPTVPFHARKPTVCPHCGNAL